MMDGEYLQIAEREQPVLFATLFSEGLQRRCFERATTGLARIFSSSSSKLTGCIKGQGVTGDGAGRGECAVRKTFTARPVSNKSITMQSTYCCCLVK